jgi:hypothetical protein
MPREVSAGLDALPLSALDRKQAQVMRDGDARDERNDQVRIERRHHRRAGTE